ncbi:tail fiber protein [Jejubacter calystegiae]|uniref:Tail fiber protein n=1 Tax=Jejubacter calystegiae TaxID=2579935 RepID=A0A4P8YJC9_9ENTR|nr:tail fiber protein [Jejubacter calystegiae]QCT20851.1 tail fiber protein [Jejubacter calystegiae]
MATNDFKAFATGANANVMSQEEWEALPEVVNGFTSGKASSAQVNKALRQASFVAAALAQFVAKKTDSDVRDDGDIAAFVAKLTSGFAAQYLSRENPFGDIAADGETAISTALANLGLGEGSALPVGVPVPWPSATPPAGWLKCNGATFTAALYPKLALAYPSGKLPDLRGEFIRGWDDGRGVDIGRLLLSSQGDAIRNITGSTALSLQIESSFGWLPNVYNAGAFTYASVGGGRGATTVQSTSIDGNLGIRFDASRSVPTASENRPRNIAFNYIVRAA